MSVYKHGNWWWYDFTFDDICYRDKGGRTKTEAERAEAKKRSEVVVGYNGIKLRRSHIIPQSGKLAVLVKVVSV